MSFIKLSTHPHAIGSKLELFGDIDNKLGEYINSIDKPLGKSIGKDPLYTKASSFLYSKNDSDGYGVVFILEDEQFSLATLYPFLENLGLEYEGELDEINVLENGVEAVLHIELGFSGFDFYDTDFIKNRDFYSPQKVKAKIYAIAYSARIAIDEIIEIPAQKNHVEVGMAKHEGEILKYHTGTMRMCVPKSGDFDLNEYSLKGKIKAIREYELGTFDKTAMVYTIDALYENEESFYDIEVLVVKEAFMGDKAPQIGDFLDAFVCFDGYIINGERK